MKQTLLYNKLWALRGALSLLLVVLLSGCSDGDKPILQPALPAVNGQNVRSITHLGGVTQTYDWQLTYTGSRLTRASGTVRDPSPALDRSFSYTSTLAYQQHGVTVTNSSTEKTQLTINAQGFVDQMTVNRNIYRFTYNASGQLSGWESILFEDSFGQVRQFRSSATITYQNGNLATIIYTDADNTPVTITCVSSNQQNLNGLLPPMLSRELGCLGFEHLYYAGLLGRPTSNLVASVSFSYPDTSRNYTTQFEYSTQSGNTVLCNYHTPDGQVASISYGY